MTDKKVTVSEASRQRIGQAIAQSQAAQKVVTDLVSTIAEAMGAEGEITSFDLESGDIIFADASE